MVVEMALFEFPDSLWVVPVTVIFQEPPKMENLGIDHFAQRVQVGLQWPRSHFEYVL